MLTFSLEFNKYTLPIKKLVFVGVYTALLCLYPERLTLFILLDSLLLLLLLYLDYLYFWCTLLRHIISSVVITCLVLVWQNNRGELYVGFQISVGRSGFNRPFFWYFMFYHLKIRKLPGIGFNQHKTWSYFRMWK